MHPAIFRNHQDQLLLFQRFDLEKQMRMTKQEVKEEHKNREGDPLIKSRIRRTQREMANKRMMSDVPKADVIVTNPTHIAVAIKYEQGWMAPMVIAMGADKVAEKIKAIAKENKILVNFRRGEIESGQKCLENQPGCITQRM